MQPRTVLQANVTFLSPLEGGRKTMPQLTGGGYRPHLVVGNPTQRQAVLEGNRCVETYLAVAFLSGPQNTAASQSARVELLVPYPSVQEYATLVPGATFTIREGPKIVGFGQVVGQWYEENA